MERAWWKDSIGYIIYPESFQDSNGDGYGDLKGIESRLDYLSSLGVNLLWICPVFDSPMEDGGYDVSDYYRLNPRLGDLDDLRSLLGNAHEKGIRVLLDFPLNHTSSAHPWFRKALSDPSSEERSFYIFRKGKTVGGELLPPNNWEGFFDTSAWERVPGSDDFYLHLFSKNMPDVNWANPKLRQKYAEIAEFYLNLGVDGFRLDALAHLAKDQNFPDSCLPLSNIGTAFDTKGFSNRPELLDYLNELNESVFSRHDCLIVGEMGGCISPEESLRFTNRKSGPIDMAFNFDTVWENGAFLSIGKKDDEIKTNVISLKDNFMRWYSACHLSSDMPVYWCNHDHPRVLSQYGDVRFRKESAECLITILLFLYGTPFIYMGDEIGMSNVSYRRLEDFSSDVSAVNEIASYRKQGYSDEEILAYLNRTSRVSSRSPFQWDDRVFAGFSPLEGRYKVNSNNLEGVNVAIQEKDPSSILAFYRYAISLRKNPQISDQVLNGELHLLDRNHPDVFAFYHDGPFRLIVIANMRPKQCYFSFYYNIVDVVLHNYEGVILKDHVFSLRPYEAIVLKV